MARTVPTTRVSVRLLPAEVRKLDRLARKFWQSNRPSKDRGPALRVLLKAADARFGTYEVKFKQTRGGRTAP